MRDVRIVLRTGQPGYAPEIEVIRDYDINDYKIKSELSRSSLYATLTTSIRAYQQIHTIAENQHGLDTIIQANRRMLTHHGLRDFAENIISEISALLRSNLDALICSRNQTPSGQVHIVAASGRFAPLTNHTLDSLDDPTLVSTLEQAFKRRNNRFLENSCTLFFSGKSGSELTALLETDGPLSAVCQQLLTVFLRQHCGKPSTTRCCLTGCTTTHTTTNSCTFQTDSISCAPVGNAILTERMHMTVAVVDIDHFSQLNDALGHRYGDTLPEERSRRA